MVQLSIDSKISEPNVGNTQPDQPPGDENSTAVAGRKQTALRDLQNNNIVNVQESIGKSPIKDIGSLPENINLSGAKRAAPETTPENPSQHRSPSNNSINAQLVYVRRKPEVELGKSSTSDSTNNNTVDNLHSKQTNQQPETTSQPVSEIKEPKVSTFPSFAPFPMASSAIPSGKPSVPQPLVKSALRTVPTELNHRPLASSTAASRNLEVLRSLHWEARYTRLQTLLKKLDQRQQEDYVRLLRSLTPGELSGHAVELEKRSIQLSLEEAKELQRVDALNMLGKAKNNASLTSSRQGRQGK